MLTGWNFFVIPPSNNMHDPLLKKVNKMKKAILPVLVLVLALSLCACASSVQDNLPDNQISASPTPVPTVFVENVPMPTPALPLDEVPLETLMADFATKIQAGSAGSSLKAVGQAVRFMDWAIGTYMSEEEIFAAVDFYLSQLDEAAYAEYMMQLELLDYTYQLLLTPGQEELLATAGCAESNYPWSDKPLRAAECFMNAAGLRATYQLPLEYTEAQPAINELYSDYLSDCYHALNERWEFDYMMEQGLNATIFQDFLSREAYSPISALDELGYCLYDVNGDDIDELIIGKISLPNEVFNILSCTSGTLTTVFEGWERNLAFICSDGTVVTRGSGGAAVTYYTYYKFDGSALTPFGSVIHDGNASPNAPWFVSQDGDMDITNDIPATQEQAQGIIAQYEALYIPFALTPLSSLANQ